MPENKLHAVLATHNRMLYSLFLSDIEPKRDERLVSKSRVIILLSHFFIDTKILFACVMCVKLFGVGFCVCKYSLRQQLDHSRDCFGYLEENEPLEISWQHVCGHFCYTRLIGSRQQKPETSHIKHYGIKDGHQLQFFQHNPVIYNLINRRSKRHVM